MRKGNLNEGIANNNTAIGRIKEVKAGNEIIYEFMADYK